MARKSVFSKNSCAKMHSKQKKKLLIYGLLDIRCYILGNTELAMSGLKKKRTVQASLSL